MPIGKISEVADAYEALREQVEQETTQELFSWEFHLAFYVSMGAISPAECDIPIPKRNQAMVGNGHSMRVAAEISENIFRTTERSFTVNDPFVSEELTDKAVKCLRVGKMLQFAMEADFAFGESVFESCPEFPSKEFGKYLLWQKEAIAWIDGHPALMIEGQSARGHDAVHVRMVLHSLSPAMEHAKETDLGTQMFGITSGFDEGFGTEAQQHRVDQFLVLECELRQQARHGEDDVSVGHRKKFFPSPLDPAPAGVGLTFRAVPITARVIGGAGISATSTLVEMPAESGGPAAFDSSQDLDMLRGNPLAAAFDETFSRGADDIGHLQAWPVHLWLLCLGCFFWCR